MADWLLYEHDDGRHAVAPSAEAATFAHGDPAWHRVGPVEVQAIQPSAWLVTGGRTYHDKAYTEREFADFEVMERRDGSRVEPLYAASGMQEVQRG